MRMDAKIWQELPEDLLLMILGRLPVRHSVKLRTVCKRWNHLLCCRDTLQRIMNANLSNPMSPIPGFLVQTWTFAQHLETWVIEGNGSEVYRVRLRQRVVMDACNNLIFCYNRTDGDHSIENPATRTSRRLPRPPDGYDWWFNAMAFDASTRRATVVVGTNNYARIGKDAMNIMEMEIYDSDSNAWSSISMTVPEFISPIDRGIYSRGKFYWLIDFSHACERKRMVAFTVADRVWEEIPLPEEGTWATPTVMIPYFDYSCLSGCDGRVVFICQKVDRDICLWKLNENNGHEWCELRVDLPKGLDTIKSVTGFSESDSVTLERPVYAAVNNSGWIMVVDQTFKAFIFNEEGKLVRRVRLPRSPEDEAVNGLGSDCSINVLPLEANNIWWPQ